LKRYDSETRNFLHCAFPDGLADAEYFPLLYLLCQEMTLRAASWLVGVLVGKNYMEIYNDALGSQSSYVPDMQVSENLKARLDACGYQGWLDG
jgi:hypothetical protein